MRTFWRSGACCLQLPAATPMRLRVLLRRCLQKDPKKRLQAIGDARISPDEVIPTDRPLTTRRDDSGLGVLDRVVGLEEVVDVRHLDQSPCLPVECREQDSAV